MGWLFGSKKKAPRVPLPEGRVIDEKALQFPLSEPSSRTIAFNDIRTAMSEPMDFKSKATLAAPARVAVTTGSSNVVVTRRFGIPKPYYVKVDVYQQLLAEIEGLHKDTHTLDSTNRHLETSEYNEEENYEKVRRSLKSAHDRLQAVDRVLFRARE